MDRELQTTAFRQGYSLFRNVCTTLMRMKDDTFGAYLCFRKPIGLNGKRPGFLCAFDAKKQPTATIGRFSEAVREVDAGTTRYHGNPTRLSWKRKERSHVRNGFGCGRLRNPLPSKEGVKELQKSGFDMKKISIVGKHHTDEQVGRYDNTGDRMKYWGKMGLTRAVCGGGCSESRSL